MENTIVVTRHPALVALLQERGLIEEGVRVIPHATPQDVRGKHVIGILPLSLAALAASVTEIPLNLSAELRGKELDLETLRRIAAEPVTYKVTVVPLPTKAAVKEETITLFREVSQNGRWGLALVGPSSVSKPGIELSYFGHVWLDYTFEEAGSAAGIDIYRLVPAPGMFVLVARQDIYSVKNCQAVHVDLQGNGDISLVTGDPSAAVWRQWRVKRRGSILMRLGEAGRPREVEPHEAIALGLGIPKITTRHI